MFVVQLLQDGKSNLQLQGSEYMSITIELSSLWGISLMLPLILIANVVVNVIISPVSLIYDHSPKWMGLTFLIDGPQQKQ